MKSISNLLFSIVLLTILSCSPNEEQSKFELVSKTDTNGYNYESVTKDPTATRIYTLKNGFKVYLTRKPNTTLVNATIAVNAGTSFDPQDNTGLAHYLEHALFEGTSKIGALDWEKEKKILDEMTILYERHKNSTDSIEKQELLTQIDNLNYKSSELSINTEYGDLKTSIGVVFASAMTKPDKTRYFAKFPKTALESFLAIESERFKEFVPRNFQNVLEDVYEEFNEESDNVWEIKYNAIIGQLYKKHPYGISPIGISSHLKNPSIKATQDFFNTYYVPNNMALILTGDFDFDNAIQLVDKTFGNLKKKEAFKLPQLPKEEPITNIRATEVYSQDEECVYLGFRYENGVWSKSEMFIRIIDKLLINGYSGLFDEELKGKQRVSNVKTEIEKARDYGIHLLDGYPKKGQALKEVESLILSQIERIKQGDFDDALFEAVINDIKITESQDFEDQWVGAYPVANAFLYNISWDKRLSYANDLSKITKQEIMGFAKEFYKNNYAVVYKRKGTREINKVAKPKFTLPVDNKDKTSAFANTIKNIPISKLKPKFLDFKKDLNYTALNNNIPVTYIEKNDASTFEINFIYHVGNMHNKQLKLAVSLWKEIGAGNKTAKDLKKELYKYGTKLDFYSQESRTIFNIQGLKENMKKSIELVNSFLNNPNIEEESFTKSLQQTIENRKAFKNSKRGMVRAPKYYAFSGVNSSFRDVLPLDSLDSISSKTVLNEIKSLKNVEQEIFYSGCNHKDAVNILNNSYNILTPLKTFSKAYKYASKKATKNVFFVDYKMNQAHIFFLANGPKFNASNWPYTNMFNFYFRNEFSNEISRRALAYSSYTYHLESSRKDGFDTFEMYAATQVDKYDDLLKFMEIIINNMPQSEKRFKEQKENLLGRFESERIVGASIFWTYQNTKKQGLGVDPRINRYNTIKSMTLKDITDYHNNFIKKYGYNIVVVGDKSKINMKELAKYGKVIELTQYDLFGKNY